MSAIRQFESDTSTVQRFESKYLISEAQARAVTEFIQPLLRPDEHGREYTVDTTYLDSADFRLYRSSVCGEKNRFKLRVRTYRGDKNGRAYLEIKQRFDRAVHKERAPVPLPLIEGYLSGGSPSAARSLTGSSEDEVTAQQFRRLRASLNAFPKVDVTYSREAYMGYFDERVRVTFDRDIMCMPARSKFQKVELNGAPPMKVLTTGVVFEVKFVEQAPHWLAEAVRRFELRSQSVSKYVLSVNAVKRLGEHPHTC